jgi:hypothetical protein
MTIVTSLGAAPGIQRTMSDNSTLPLPAVLTVGLVIGHFKLGRVDKPFIVTSKTYRARLGHEPENPYYQIVQDAFDMGISELWIMRVVKSEGTTTPPGDDLFISWQVPSIEA